MTSLSQYYGETGQIIIGTDHGDIIVHAFIDFCEHIKVGDKISVVEWVETNDPNKPELNEAKWFQRIENLINKTDHDQNLLELLGDATITIDDRYLSVDSLTLFGELDLFTKGAVNLYLEELKK